MMIMVNGITRKMTKDEIAEWEKTLQSAPPNLELNIEISNMQFFKLLKNLGKITAKETIDACNGKIPQFIKSFITDFYNNEDDKFSAELYFSSAKSINRENKTVKDFFVYNSEEFVFEDFWTEATKIAF